MFQTHMKSDKEGSGSAKELEKDGYIILSGGICCYKFIKLTRKVHVANKKLA